MAPVASLLSGRNRHGPEKRQNNAVASSLQLNSTEQDKIATELATFLVGLLWSCDVVVGVPSYNEADSIANVVQKVDEGLTSYFPDARCAIVNADNDSADGTKDVFMKVPSSNPKAYISTATGVKGKGNNMYNLLVAATVLNAKALVVVDADLLSITPGWMKRMAGPIVSSGEDMVFPKYARHQYDGTITNMICYPLVHGLLGVDVRQPIGGDFAMSGDLCKFILEQRWIDSTKLYGIDIFLTCSAIKGRYSLAQSFLGTKCHKPSAPKLGPMATQVVTQLFDFLLDMKDRWGTSAKVQKTALYENWDDVVDTAPQDMFVDVLGLRKLAAKSVEGHVLHLPKIVSSRLWEQIGNDILEGKFEVVTSEVWMEILFSALQAYETSGRDPSTIEAVKALYFCRVVSYVEQTENYEYAACEQIVQNQAGYLRSLMHVNDCIKK